MAEAANNPQQLPEEELYQEDSLAERFMEWVRTELIWYAGSFTFHLLLLSSLLLLGNVAARGIQGDAPGFDSTQNEEEKTADPPPLDKFDIGETPEDPTELTTETLTMEKPAVAAQTEEYIDDSEKFEHQGGGTANASKDPSLGGLGGFSVLAYGAGTKVTGKGGVGTGVGTGTHGGSGGAGSGFGGRGSGHRRAQLGSGGGTKAGERAVAGALHWLYRHQLPDGSWSLVHTQRCVNKSCTGVGNASCPAGATALGLLPFLAAGQTHKTNGPYRTTIQNALLWMLRHQEPSGSMMKGEAMYSHGLCTIALCEAYGLSGDHAIGFAAQRAVNFIISAQATHDYGWHYQPNDNVSSDTSVVGWQVMGLKSAIMAGLNAGTSFELSAKWFDLAKSGPNGSNFSYMVGSGATPAMTAVGLLCRQYLGAKRSDPMMIDGAKYLMRSKPDLHFHNIYYWYYATQVMHNYAGDEWDEWNRAMRKLLISTQTHGGCANGSWDPDNPVKDAWSAYGGRHLLTCLACLTLEVYYRYLPLYKVDAEGGGGGAAPAPARRRRSPRKRRTPKPRTPKPPQRANENEVGIEKLHEIHASVAREARPPGSNFCGAEGGSDGATGRKSWQRPLTIRNSSPRRNCIRKTASRNDSWSGSARN